MWCTIALTGTIITTLLALAACAPNQLSEPKEDALQERQRETERLRPLLERVLPLQSECDAMDPLSTVPVHGKVLVWAADYGYRSKSIEPANLRADSLDEPITVFLYRSHRQDRGWFLTNANDQMKTVLRYPAYRQDIDMCAVYWPEARVAGRIILEGGEPPMAGGQPQAEHGTLPDLAAWLDRQSVEMP